MPKTTKDHRPRFRRAAPRHRHPGDLARQVIWKKGGMEAIEIQKDTGTGWQFLATEARPDYIDTTPFPTPPAVWKYRAIYTKDSQRLRQWSNVATISVGA